MSAKSLRKLRGIQSLEPRNMLTTFTVNSIADAVNPLDNFTTLREAIDLANTNPGADDIVFSLSGTIQLSMGELTIDDTLKIDGGEEVEIDGQLQTNLFRISSSTISGDIEFHGLRLANGRTMNFDDGSAIENQSTNKVVVKDCVVENNIGYSIDGSSADLELIDSQFVGNYGVAKRVAHITITDSLFDSNAYNSTGEFNIQSASATITGSIFQSNGGGVAVFGAGGGHAEVVDSSFINHRAGYNAAISARSITILRSTFVDNASDEGNAGAVASGSFGGDTIIHDSAFFDNSATDLGSDGAGAIWAGGDVRIYNSTFSGNRGVGYGGRSAGAITSAKSIELFNSTVTDNIGSHAGNGIRGGGLIAYDGIHLENSIIANNKAEVGFGTNSTLEPNDLHLSGSMAVVTSKSSLIGTDADIDGAPLPVSDLGGNIIGSIGNEVDPRLSPIGDYGGGTLTHKLLPDSPAFNAGDPTAVAGAGDVPLYDQRGSGFVRVVGSAIDMGAYEFEGSLDGDEDVDGDDVDTICLAIQNGLTDAAFDVDGSGTVDSLDFIAYLNLIGILPGDANLDGLVDVQDFNIWNNNKFATNDPSLPDSGWENGNFNCDGAVDVADFNVWNAEKFNSALAAFVTVDFPFFSEEEDRNNRRKRNSSGPSHQ